MAGRKGSVPALHLPNRRRDAKSRKMVRFESPLLKMSPERASPGPPPADRFVGQAVVLPPRRRPKRPSAKVPVSAKLARAWLPNCYRVLHEKHAVPTFAAPAAPAVPPAQQEYDLFADDGAPQASDYDLLAVR